MNNEMIETLWQLIHAWLKNYVYLKTVQIFQTTFFVLIVIKQYSVDYERNGTQR